jgi:hypothetical protein
MSGERYKEYLVLIARRQLRDYLLDNDVTQVGIRRDVPALPSSVDRRPETDRSRVHTEAVNGSPKLSTRQPGTRQPGKPQPAPAAWVTKSPATISLALLPRRTWTRAGCAYLHGWSSAAAYQSAYRLVRSWKTKPGPGRTVVAHKACVPDSVILADTEEVTGSIPVSPTSKTPSQTAV